MKRRIAHICLSCFYIDNMGYQENILPKKHFQQGNNVEIITSSFDEKNNRRTISRYKNENGIEVVVLPYKWFLGKVAVQTHFVSGLYKELVSFQPDIIFCHGLSFLSIFELEKYCRNNNVVLYFDNHSDYFNTPTKGGKYRVINGWFWPIIAHSGERYCRKAWGTTPARCDYLINTYGFPKEKVDLLVMGGDDDYINLQKRDIFRSNISEKYSISTDSFWICTGGKLNNSKKTLELINAVERLNKDVVLLIFGSIMNDIKDNFDIFLSNSKKIHYLGWKNQEEIYGIFIASDLAVFPGTHSVLWEQAVSCGLPALYKKRDMMEHVDVGGNCKLIVDDSEDGLMSELDEVLSDKISYNRMKNTALDKGMKYFSYNFIAKKAIGL